MADRSKIEWTDASWSPVRARNLKTGKVGWHCEHATPGCEHCYAESMNARLGTGLPFKPGHRADVEIFLDPKMLLQPLRWARPRMIFVCSMTDLFADFVTDAMIDQVFAVIALCPQHTFQVLTKRSARMRAYFAQPRLSGRLARICVDYWLANDVDGAAMMNAETWPVRSIGDPENPDDIVMRRFPLPNVWLGVSAEDQRRADERVPDLLATPAAVRFVSAEPLLGPIDFHNLRTDQTEIGWIDALRCIVPRKLDLIIAGSESGPRARPCEIAWVRAICGQCATAGVSFFWKQHVEGGRKISLPELDGRQWAELPRFTSVS